MNYIRAKPRSDKWTAHLKRVAILAIEIDRNRTGCEENCFNPYKEKFIEWAGKVEHSSDKIRHRFQALDGTFVDTWQEAAESFRDAPVKRETTEQEKRQMVLL